MRQLDIANGRTPVYGHYRESEMARDFYENSHVGQILSQLFL